jgi:hypothetical protein
MLILAIFLGWILVSLAFSFILGGAMHEMRHTRRPVATRSRRPVRIQRMAVGLVRLEVPRRGGAPTV